MTTRNTAPIDIEPIPQRAQPPKRYEHLAVVEDIGRTSYREWSDLDLVGALDHDSSDAYEEIVRRYSSSVYAATRMVLIDQSKVEDVVAEVFAALWICPGKFDPQRGALSGYLRLKARARSIDIIRAESSLRRRELSVLQVSGTDSPEIDAGLFASESVQAIRNALTLLPLIEREPIELAFFAGMSYKAVARRLHIPEGTTKSRIRSGLKHLSLNDGIRVLSDLNDHVDDTDCH